MTEANTRRFSLLSRVVGRHDAPVEKFHFGAELAQRLVAKEGLRDRLQAVADAICELPTIAGSMVMVCDRGGIPIRIVESGLTFVDEPARVGFRDACYEHIRAKEYERDWDEVTVKGLRAAADHHLFAYPIQCQGEMPSGVVVVALPGKLGSESPAMVGKSDLVTLSDAHDYLDGIFQEIRKRHWQDLEVSLYKAAATFLTGRASREEEELGETSLNVDCRGLVEELGEQLQAQFVSILFREMQKMVVVATTDSVLKGRLKAPHSKILKKMRLGLTAFVMEHRRSIRLENGNDPEELLQVTGGAVKRPYHLEFVAPEPENPVRLLLVPLILGDETVGVLRLLRSADQPPFSAHEALALQPFARLLATALDASFEVHLGQEIRSTQSEAFCISRGVIEKKGGRRYPEFVYVNRGARDLFGRDRKELIRRDVRRFYANRQEYEKVRASLREILEAGGRSSTSLISQIKGPEGDARSVEISYRLLRSPFGLPAAKYTISVFRDVTEKEIGARRHQRLVSLLDEMGMAYFRTDRKLRTVESTEAESAILGYSSEEIRRVDRGDFYASAARRREFVRRVARAKGRLVKSTQLFRRKDGELIWVEGAMHLLLDSRQRPAGFEGIYEDVTERVGLQDVMGLDTEEVLRAQEFKEELRKSHVRHLDFIKSTSHQLRSPLGALIAHLHELSDRVGGDDPGLQGNARAAIYNATACASMVRDLTYMDALLRRQGFKFRPLDLAGLANGLRKDFEYLLNAKNLTLGVNTASLENLQRNEKIWGHEQLIRQVLVNLVENAIKYSGEREKIQILGRDGGSLGRILEVRNRGIRIPREERQKVFERGFRSEKAQAATDGTGTGLWLVKRVTEIHGGSVSCSETFGSKRPYTIFRIAFPRGELRESVDWSR